MKRPRLVCLAAGLAALAGPACVVSPYAGPPAGAPPAAERTHDPFPYPRRPFPFQLERAAEEPREEQGTAQGRGAVDPGAGRSVVGVAEATGAGTWVLTYPAAYRRDPLNPTVRAVLRRPAGEPAGLIVVLPILGGDYGPSDTLARSLTERGFVTLRFDRKDELFDTGGHFEVLASRIRQSVIDVRRGIDWAVATGADGGAGVGLLGVSMGAIVGSQVAASDDRVEAPVLALLGGGLAEGLEHVRGEIEVDAFYAGVRARGLSDDEARAEARRTLPPVDPLSHVGRLDPSRTLIIHARFDDLVPMEIADRVWEAAGRPRRVVLPTGHYTAGLLLPYIEDVVAEHFEAHLGPGRD